MDELDGFFGELDRFAGFGGDDDDGVADEGDFFVGEEMFVLDDGAEDVVAGNVFGGEDEDDAGNFFGGGDVDGEEAAVGDGGADDIDDEFAVERGHVVDEYRNGR